MEIWGSHWVLKNRNHTKRNHTESTKAGCKISIGTGTLDSLKWSQIPLRAEIIDITNSCLEGIDYIALTSETAASQHPFKVLDFIQHILNYIKGID